MAQAKLTSYSENGYIPIFENFRELFLTSFTYENLPEEINPFFIESVLFSQGQCAFFQDDEIGFVVTRATWGGGLDVYGEPARLQCIGGGGGAYRKTRTNNVDAVLMYNNFTHNSPIDRLTSYALRIHQIENTIDININAQKTPYLVKGTKKSEFTMKRIFSQMAEFIPGIFVDESVDLNQTMVFPTIAPFVADKLEDEKRKLINEALSFIGIDNNSAEKNERLLADEILVSNGLAIANRNSRLRSREIAVDKINAMFGLDIKVKFNNPSFYNDPYLARKMADGEPEPEEETGGENDG
jgi:hypothetical protein